MKYKRNVLTKPSEENNQLNESTHSRKGKRFGFKHWHMVSFLLFAYDVIAVNGAYFLSLWLRFDCEYSKIFDGVAEICAYLHGGVFCCFQVGTPLQKRMEICQL